MNRRIDYYNDPDTPAVNAIAVGGSALITDDQGRILLQQRADSGNWALPGGAMNIGETLAQAVIREVKEESAWTSRLPASSASTPTRTMSLPTRMAKSARSSTSPSPPVSSVANSPSAMDSRAMQTRHTGRNYGRIPKSPTCCSRSHRWSAGKRCGLPVPRRRRLTMPPHRRPGSAVGWSPNSSPATGTLPLSYAQSHHLVSRERE
ncbi:MAG TPA: NUDIX domain-containing protein [Micromonosporaceae bacterium]